VTAKRGRCPVCRYSYRLKASGTIQRHRLYCGNELLPDICRGSEMMPLGADGGGPRRIMVAGDFHGNTAHALGVVRAAAGLLRDEPLKLIVQAGDFGLWPGGGGYIRALSRELDTRGVTLWFADGNHDDHGQLRELHARERGPVAVDPDGRIWHLPRAHRWNWHGRTWLALGGGVSLDRAIRAEGRDWWPEEEIAEDQAAEAVEGGPAHVMVTHDAPSRVTYSFPPPPPFWAARDLARSDRHRERLQDVVNQVRPGWLAHGHLHLASQRLAEFAYGSCEVTSLDRDGGRGPNWAVLDVKTMRWETE
jgi:hypothetical protein